MSFLRFGRFFTTYSMGRYSGCTLNSIVPIAYKNQFVARHSCFAAEKLFNRRIKWNNNSMKSMSSSKIEDMTNDPARNLNHEAMMSRKKDGPLLTIDVREPAELAETGVVPDSINIPLKNIEDALGPMTPEAFRQTYGAEKPTKGTLIVFSCRSGKRSRVALAKALSLGYLNSSHYEGGWLEWEKHLKN